MTRFETPASALPTHLVWLGLSVMVALGYLFGLGGDHIPRNGDELVYANIARLTAESGHWLPLVSHYDFMRNTKPPLLFWQAIVAGGWGEHWTLLNLRLPSVLYSWAVALMVGVLTWKMALDTGSHHASPLPSGEGEAEAKDIRKHQRAVTLGAIAAIVYLSFFSSYRYGRPYLTSAAETFWLFGVFFALAWSPARLLASRWAFPLLAGAALGVGCLYKSFAMVVPVGFALALCYQCIGAQKMPWQIVRSGFLADALKMALLCAVGLGVFGLWFVLDPQPGEVWREFVVGENAGKFNSQMGYFKQALSSSGGFLVVVTSYFTNAGLLLPVTVGCAWAAWRSHRQHRALSPAEKVLWLWMLALALVFMLPNQRSARYLIPAMPAVAILVALYWSRIGRIWFGITLLFCLIGTLAMGSIAYGALRATQDDALYGPLFWLFLVATALACLAGMVKPSWTRPVAALASFCILFSLAWATEPFNGPVGQFKPATLALLRGQSVAVPTNFNGQFERYQFVINGAKIAPYFAAQPVEYTDVEALFKTSRYALVQRRMGQSPCTACRIIDVRWDLRSRQEEGSLAAFKNPETFWYAQEYLVERLAP